MADARRHALSAQLDIRQILLEAQHRWLRPAEICEILQNYKKFQINPDPPDRPSSGSLFLFDRKVLRYFRKDGHNWRKKRDGKTVKEAHERLKCGSVDVLHCYYAHGEDNENFQRRSYWMLEEELSHIVLVHYRLVEGNGTNFNRIREAVPNVQRVDNDVPNLDMISNSASVGNRYGYHVTSQITDTSAQTSEYEDAESAYTHQSSSGFHTFLEVQPLLLPKVEDRLPMPNHVASSSNYQGQISAAPDLDFTSITLGDTDQNTISTGLTYRSGGNSEFPARGNALGNWSSGVHPVSFKPLPASSQVNTIGAMHQVANHMLGQVLTDTASQKQDLMTPDGMQQWQTSEDNTLDPSKWPMDQKLNLQSANNLAAGLSEVNNLGLKNPSDTPATVDPSAQINLPAQFIDTGHRISKNSVMNSKPSIEGKTGYSTLRQPLLDGVLKEGLQKLDSFDRWMTKELGDVNESHIQTTSGANWETVRNEDGMSESNIASQTYTLSPSLSQDQLFSILDFSPNWAYSASEEKVLITGRFLKSQTELGKYQWACMFGELEVPAEVIGGGVIRCHTPKHEDGRVPFYVTCSNRLACSEVREFEFRVRTAKDEDSANFDTGSMDDCRHLVRFGKLLTAGFNNLQSFGPNLGDDIYSLRSNIESYLKEEDNTEWEHMLILASDKLSVEKVKDRLMRKLLKNQLHLWLLRKHAECDKGPNVLDDCGQGVLHLAAALGYDWAIEPILVGGVSVDFRDLNGWTALHWAAFYGRERTVASLISLGASPGALTDPTPRYPAGRAPADLASTNGHKGIAGYLAESTLSSHLILLKLKDNQNSLLGEPTGEDVQTASERTATPIGDGDLAQGVSLKDSLAAVRNATQAAARIHQVFRLQSFQKKQIKEYGDGELSISDGRALSQLSGKTKRAGIHDEPVHAAATRIQNKFRSWKGRKEYLRTRQRIIKIQAHVRGHQVRKDYKKITWSVGVLEKIILRWRRKGSGLRGYKPESPYEVTRTEEVSSTGDEYDFFKEGRKQTEERLQKALTRVKSMVQYPEARDQYRRLLNVVSEMQSSKTRFDKVLNDSDETVDFDEDMIDLDALLCDDPLMCT